MMPRELIAAFDTLAEAPEGVKRLRQLVLQLAVRGKLVPQDPGEEPAAAVLRRISDGKPGQFKATAGGRAHLDVDAPEAELPTGWCTAALGSIADCRLGKMLDKAKNKGTPRRYLRNANVRWFGFDLGDVLEMRLDDNEAEQLALVEGDLLICEGGEPGRAAVCDTLVAGMVFQKALHRVRPRGGVSPHYLARVLQGDAWAGRLDGHFTGATIKHFTGKALAEYSVPLPPVREQHRIAAKVDNLMALLDKLEKAKAIRDATRRALRDASLAALRYATDAEEAEVAWGRIASQMADLFVEPEDLAPLRQALLQLAVRGRLVGQQPGDGPDTWRLSAQDGAAAGPVCDRPFDIPAGWSWLPMSAICNIASGATKGRSLSGPAADTPYLRVANVQAGRVDLTVVKMIPATACEVEQYRLEPGDVLLTEGGDWDKLGRSAVWDGTIPNCIHQNHVFRARCDAGVVLPHWLSQFTNSLDGRAYFQSCSKQTTNLASINMTQLRRCPVPVPPLPEQHRIIAKVHEQMAVIDALEARLRGAQQACASFAASAVQNLEV